MTSRSCCPPLSCETLARTSPVQVTGPEHAASDHAAIYVDLNL